MATRFGKWWGTNPVKREQTDIDVVAGDPQSKTVLLGECKWRNTSNETRAMESLHERIGLIDGYTTTHLALFTKQSVREATKAKYGAELLLVDAEKLYE